MKAVRILAALVLVLLTAWASMALAIDGPLAGRGGVCLGGAWFVAAVAAGFLVRPLSRAFLVVLVLDVSLAAWWLAIEPRNDRDWIAEVRHAPRADFDGDVVRIHNVRNFFWRSDSDFDEVWEERTYDLSEVRAADLMFSYWGAPMIAHTIMSWEFADGRHLAISIETRKEAGEEYSALLGFFRQYELYYVVSDERDVVGVRTNVRGEDVFLYRLSAPPERARHLLVDYLERINKLADHPAWYNALTQNCTTTIWRHARSLDTRPAWDWRILANGSADALLYLRGSVDTSMPFEELRRRSDVTAAAREAGHDENFSARIRLGRPRMTAAN